VIYELLLISVVIVAGYWGWFFVRHRPDGTATFGIMQLAAAVLAGLGLVGRKVDAAWLGAAGAIGLGGGACLLVLGPIVRVVARRLVAAERMGLAMRLLDFVELIAPGSGVAEEKALVRAMTEIREGRIEQTVDALTAAKQRAPAAARLAIDERIAMLYVTAYRWSDAIAHAEAHLFGALPADGQRYGQRDGHGDGHGDGQRAGHGDGPGDGHADGRGDGPGGGSLRGALGVAPPVWVELIAAYGRVGDLDQAARMLARLEDVCAGRDDAALWIHRARLVFLAFAGRIDAVRALVAPRRARHMTAAARTYWMAVAYDHHGDRAEAARAYERARARSRGRPRELIDQALARLAGSAEVALPGRTEIAPVANEVVARIEAAPLPPPIRMLVPHGPRATWLVTAVLLAVSATTALAIGETGDLGVLLRAGARFHGMVADGQWWRLIACVFVHAGVGHLVVNALGMFFLGRLAEDLFGSVRMIAIFGFAGISGALASYLASPGGMSSGASGAIFGLLGAVFVEITWHRQRYRHAWRRGMWGALAVVTVAQLGYDFFNPVIDQWAHGGGLLAGGLLGFVLSPNARWARVGGILARAIALGFGVAVLSAGVLVVRTSVADSLTAGGTTRHVIDGVAITVPQSWQQASSPSGTPSSVSSSSASLVFQPDGLVVIALVQTPRVDPAQQIAMWVVEEGRHVKELLGEVTAAREATIVLPAGWDGTELETAHKDTMDYRQRARVIVCGRAFGDAMVLMAIQVPETVARAAPEFLAAVIASTGPA
jgi:membrane associated rhomboid family serine protease